jgi:hypothetical protein
LELEIHGSNFFIEKEIPNTYNDYRRYYISRKNFYVVNCRINAVGLIPAQFQFKDFFFFTAYYILPEQLKEMAQNKKKAYLKLLGQTMFRIFYSAQHTAKLFLKKYAHYASFNLTQNYVGLLYNTVDRY